MLRSYLPPGLRLPNLAGRHDNVEKGQVDDALNRIPVYMSKNRNERKKKQRSRGRKRREERKERFLISTAIAVPGLFAAMFFCVEAAATSTSRTLTI